jgi:hypothetical protein
VRRELYSPKPDSLHLKFTYYPWHIPSPFHVRSIVHLFQSFKAVNIFEFLTWYFSLTFTTFRVLAQLPVSHFCVAHFLTDSLSLTLPVSYNGHNTAPQQHRLSSRSTLHCRLLSIKVWTICLSTTRCPSASIKTTFWVLLQYKLVGKCQRFRQTFYQKQVITTDVRGREGWRSTHFLQPFINPSQHRRFNTEDSDNVSFPNAGKC